MRDNPITPEITGNNPLFLGERGLAMGYSHTPYIEGVGVTNPVAQRSDQQTKEKKR